MMTEKIECPLDKILPNGELVDFVHEQREINREIRDMRIKMPKSWNRGTIWSLIATGFIFFATVVFGAGRIIGNNTTKIDEHLTHSQMLELQVNDNTKGVAEFKKIADDVKWIREYLIEHK